MTKTNNPSISVGIPCIPRDLSSLAYCIKSVNAQSVAPIEIVVSLSDHRGEPLDEYQALSRYPFKIISSREKKFAGENRNVIARHATGEYIAYIDADDIMHPDRLKVLLTRIKAHRPDAIYHAYKKRRLMNYLTEPAAIIKPCLDSDTIKADYFKVHQNLEQILALESKAPKYRKMKAHRWVCFGHPTLRREVLVNNPMSTTLQRGEDVAYLFSLLWQQQFNVLFEPAVLSFYFPSQKLDNFWTKRRRQKTYAYLDTLI